MTTWCVDERHGVPCPEPCDGCLAEGCDPKAKVETDTSEGAMRAAGWDEAYIAEALERSTVRPLG